MAFKTIFLFSLAGIMVGESLQMNHAKAEEAQNSLSFEGLTLINIYHKGKGDPEMWRKELNGTVSSDNGEGLDLHSVSTMLVDQIASFQLQTYELPNYARPLAKGKLGDMHLVYIKDLTANVEAAPNRSMVLQMNQIVSNNVGPRGSLV